MVASQGRSLSTSNRPPSGPREPPQLADIRGCHCRHLRKCHAAGGSKVCAATAGASSPFGPQTAPSPRHSAPDGLRGLFLSLVTVPRPGSSRGMTSPSVLLPSARAVGLGPRKEEGFLRLCQAPARGVSAWGDPPPFLYSCGGVLPLLSGVTWGQGVEGLKGVWGAQGNAAQFGSPQPRCGG